MSDRGARAETEELLGLLVNEIEVQLSNEEDASAYHAMRGIQTALVAVLLSMGWNQDPSGEWFKQEGRASQVSQ